MTTVLVTQIARESLQAYSSKIKVGQLPREVLYTRNPKVNVPQVYREILHSRIAGQLQCLMCDVAEVYFNPGTFIDFTNPTNRAKFHDSNLRPVPVGTTGSVPTSVAPTLYLTVPMVNIVPQPYVFPTNASGHGAVELVTTDNRGLGYGIAQAPNPTD